MFKLLRKHHTFDTRQPVLHAIIFSCRNTESRLIKRNQLDCVDTCISLMRYLIWACANGAIRCRRSADLRSEVEGTINTDPLRSSRIHRALRVIIWHSSKNCLIFYFMLLCNVPPTSIPCVTNATNLGIRQPKTHTASQNVLHAAFCCFFFKALARIDMCACIQYQLAIKLGRYFANPCNT